MTVSGRRIAIAMATNVSGAQSVSWLPTRLSGLSIRQVQAR